MTVGELIQQLQALPPTRTVIVDIGTGGMLTVEGIEKGHDIFDGMVSEILAAVVNVLLAEAAQCQT